jgi:predicted  nucleic acid-binding Zn-ribbon protein
LIDGTINTDDITPTGPDLTERGTPTMPSSTAAESLRDLHALHQRSRALRDRLASGPKTLASREQILATRHAALEQARKALKEARAQTKNREVQLQQVETRLDDLRTKLNQAKKQSDYDAIRNQMAHDNLTKSKYEDEILQALESTEAQALELATLESDYKTLEADVASLRADLEAQRGPQEAQLKDLEEAILTAEAIIPADQRDQYRRVIKQRGADAMSQVERDGNTAMCHGCYVSVTTQMLNELINAETLVFCKTCGRVLYLGEEAPSTTRRKGR